MAPKKEHRSCDLGIIGLGVMGSNFALNVADRGFSVAGYNRKQDKIIRLSEIKSEHPKIETTRDLQTLYQMVRTPRSLLLLVPEGGAVDAVIEGLMPHLEAGDLIIDGGNSHFRDTDRRGQLLAKNGLLYMGMGISGGESDTRLGPCLMPGGPEQGYERVKPILEATAAQVDATPCVAYLGPGSAGHYVKMVHHGIEYSLMQLIAETYDLLKRGLGMAPAELHTVFKRWNENELNSYLLEITADIFIQQDDRTGTPLIDLILDESKHKGTGGWNVREALELQVPAFTFAAAVMMRDISALRNQREPARHMFKGPSMRFDGERDQIIHQIKDALYAAIIITFAQGLNLLSKASKVYRYQLNLENITRIWRGGCIIRANVLEEIRSAYQSQPDLENLLLDGHLGRVVAARETDLREVVRTGVDLGLPMPGLMTALAYFDALRSDWLPANLIMAQRDYFGSHTYERVDATGAFHTHWGKPKGDRMKK